MKINLKYISVETNRHGNDCIYIPLNGRRVRIREQPNTPAFMLAYSAAVDALGMPPEHARRANGRVITPGSLAAIAAKYFGSKDFQRRDATSQRNRRNIIELCLREKLAAGP